MSWTVYLLAAGLATTTAAPAPQQPAPDKTPITITGCVAKGQDSDKVMLTGVRLTSGTPPAGIAPDQMYLRLDSASKLKEHVGHQVSVAGNADFKDLDKGSLEVKPNDDATVTVTLTSERKSVSSTTSPANPTAAEAPVGTSGGKVEVPTYKMSVESVRMLAGSCPQ